MADVDTQPLYGTDGCPTPWWFPEGVRTSVTLDLPAETVAALVAAQKLLGVAASDFAAYWISRGVDDASRRHARMLAGTEDHSRIVGWDPDGTPHMVEHQGGRRG